MGRGVIVMKIKIKMTGRRILIRMLIILPIIERMTTITIFFYSRLMMRMTIKWRVMIWIRMEGDTDNK